MSFLEFLRTTGAMTTDDVLASVVPLLQQVEQTHQAGRVAPLDGVDRLLVDADRRLHFDNDAATPPRLNDVRVRQIERHARTRSVDVVGQHAQTIEADGGDEEYKDLRLADPQATVERPVYVPGYRSWEHLVEHHDALTDMYVLGLVLASVACGLDFTNPKHIEAFAQHRRNLFVAWPQLNPVVAKQIVRLTELDRHRRAQDLPSVIRALETYREQNIELDLDLARIPGFHDADLKGRRRILLARLRERLFEISRRNRLLYYKPTLQTLNLTFASIPTLLDVRNIRAEQIFTWQPGIERLLAEGKPIALNKYLRFEDAPYINSVLDKVMAEARRDAAEFGFSQLRLVICFLRWNNLKENRDERIDSPLLLLPIELTKKKGVRDSYVLTATSNEAEVNPVLRYHLKHLYGIDLPFSIDLGETTIAAFYDVLVAQIQASEPGVTLTRVDRPQVEMVYARARRRLDQYRRRLRLGGAFRTFGQFDYSYNRENYQPLGLQLFTNVVRPSTAPLHEIFNDSPVREARMTGEPPAVAEKQKTLAWFREGSSDGNPYVWEFDLCNLTLGNFNYRKMSLIRDYNMLLESDRASTTFDAVFPLTPRPVEPVGSADETVFANCYPVVACDPTQLRAISAAHARRSYIVQGPPGTGKSQTITNLIADLVAQGKRILFVCEKRAAIDVVYHRLRQRGLHDLVCLIHDSQGDKREFIQDLKATYERLLAHPAHGESSAARRRSATVEALGREQQPIAAFDAAMATVHEEAGISTRELLIRAIELRGLTADAIAQGSTADLPSYRAWLDYRDTLERLAQVLRHATADGVYSRHPLHPLSPAVAKRERAAAALAEDLAATVRLLDKLEALGREHGVGLHKEDTLADAGDWLKYAETVAPLVEHSALDLLNQDSQMSQRLRQRCSAVQARRDALDKARHATRAWRRKLDPDDLERALQRARSVKGVLGWLKPDYWRLRSVLHERYDFAAHAVKPAWDEILASLKAEYEALAALEAEAHAGAQEFGITGDFTAFVDRVEVVRHDARRLIQSSRAVERLTKHGGIPVRAIAGLLAMRDCLAELTRVLAALLAAPSDYSLGSLRDECGALRQALPRFAEWQPCLAAAAELPNALTRVLRTVPLTLPQLEATIAARTLEDIMRREPALATFDGNQKRVLADRLKRLHSHWLAVNAEAVLEQHRARFLERVALASAPAARLTKEQTEFKRSYNAGRRELEHEFGKTMRYKSVRGLLHGDAGEVVLDLKPVWLMSPLSVSDTLPIDERIFDVAIFDEASQIPLEEAVPVLVRAEQVIVSGDQMQLPPTNFFSATRGGEETLLLEDDEQEGGTVEYELDSNSFLSHAARNLPSTMLGWHYRSRSESLISFSNAAFYEGRLLTVPERQTAATETTAIRVASIEDGDANVTCVLDRPVSFHFLEKGRYEARRNLKEAEYIARLVRGLLTAPDRPTIGIVAFSEAQQTAIETALERLAAIDADFAARVEEAYEREEDGQFVGLLVKNLENIQGDERDVIILSVCYGYGVDGRMLMNFGPINQSGGERRLNVAFSRAKRHMVVVSSIQHTDIKNVYNDGANALRNYLQYTAALSVGDARAAETVLRSLAPRPTVHASERGADSIVEEIAAALRQRGYECAVRLGHSRFQCDLAIRPQGESAFRLAVFVDANRDLEHAADIVEREVLKPGLLRSFGWSVCDVLAKDWYEDPDTVVARIERELAGDKDEDDSGVDSVIAEIEASAGESTTEVAEGASAAQDSAAPETEQTPPAGPVGDVPAGGVRCFEFTQGSSRKFWHVRVDGAELVVSYGRIGTDGQVKRKPFASADGARREAERLIREKLAKGYSEVA